MNKRVLDQAAREQRAYQRLGTDQPRCPACGETDWRCMQAHHVAGRRRHTFTVPVCANCHSKLSDAQFDHPPLDAAADRRLETIGHFLLGLADLCTLLVQQLKAFGHALIERATAHKSTEA